MSVNWGSMEVIAKKRDWEAKKDQIAREDRERVLRSFRYAFLILAPFWTAVVWWLTR
jgi:hypothetical protein